MFVKAGINMNDSMITSGLFELQDEGYRVFQAKLMPNISCDRSAKLCQKNISNAGSKRIYTKTAS